MIFEEIYAAARELVFECSSKKLKISAAESITGGMISAAVTSVSGSSEVFELGICSYSNRIKSEALGVSDKTLFEFSEYSERCVLEMARGALKKSGADFAVSTSGVAGPSGGTDKDPVGTVYIALCGKNGEEESFRFSFSGQNDENIPERDYIRAQAALKAITQLTKFTKRK